MAEYFSGLVAHWTCRRANCPASAAVCWDTIKLGDMMRIHCAPTRRSLHTSSKSAGCRWITHHKAALGLWTAMSHGAYFGDARAAIIWSNHLDKSDACH